jgi:hypothetical protein
MYFLFSGEGSTDMGKGKLQDQLCEGNNYELGPMAMIVDQLVKNKTNQSFIAEQLCGFIPKSLLLQRAKPTRPSKNGMVFPGIKKKKETAYFYRAARAFGAWARTEKQRRKEKVVAVLFRDSDNRASSERGEWSDKWESMINGFSNAGFSAGVPMLPKPISEAWLLCALKRKMPYENCAALERRSSSPKAKAPMKKELKDICNGDSSRSYLCDLFEKGKIEASKIDMPSFNAFRDRLLKVI